VVRVGELAAAKDVGRVLVTIARDEAAGDLVVPAK